MAYRIHFTAEDLARTRVASRPMPLMELNLALRALQDRSQPARLDRWRQHHRGRLSARERMALSLIPPVGYSPGFTGPAETGSPEELLDQVRATPRSTIRAELSAVAQYQRLPAWTRHLADDAALFRQFAAGVSDLYTNLLAPYWSNCTNLFTADRALRVRHFLTSGIEEILTQVNPQWIKWNPPVLEIRMPNGADHDLILEGQGILLVASAFFTRTLVEDEAVPQPVVTYPADLEHPGRRLTAFAPHDGDAESASAIAALLGHTRAAVLETISDHPGCTTTELASLIGITPPTVSVHTTTLRRAGLITTTRYRNTALHIATPLGTDLLNNAV